jgi:hypothetical protein
MNPASNIRAALAQDGVNIDSELAFKLSDRIGLQKLADAELAGLGLVGLFAREELAKIAAEAGAPKPQTRESRARDWLVTHNLSDGLGETKLRRWTHALNEIDKADAAGNSTHESRAVAEVLAKDPRRVDAMDMLRVGHARDADAALKPAAGIAPVAASSLPPVDPNAPRDPMKRLQSVNRLSGPLLSDWRAMSNARVRAAKMQPGADRSATERYADTLAHSLRQRGVAVP